MKTANKDRLIAMLISGGIIATGVIGAATGVAMCCKAGRSNPDNYQGSVLHNAGIITTALSSSFITIGAATYPYKDGNKDEVQSSDQNQIL